MAPMNANRSMDENDYNEIKKFKQMYDTKKALKVVFYSLALVTGRYDAEKFEKKYTPEKVRKSKLITWFL